MTYERIIATGSGRLRARLEIEGLAIQFVSDPGMEQTLADGRVRLHCFDLFGENASTVSIEESVNIPEARLEAQGTRIRLWETQAENLAQVFCYRPDLEREIEAKVATSDTSITLLSTTGVSAGDVIHIGTEAIKVGSVTSTQLTGCTRAYWGTIAQAHWSFGDADGLPGTVITERPLRVRGRRVRLYLYGDGDDGQGDGGNGGNPIWRGFVTEEPVCSEAGEMWSFGVGPLTKLLDSKLGGELDVPAGPRGIYYHWASPLKIQVYEVIASVTNPPVDYFFGFFETQEAFLDALNLWLTTSGSSDIADAGLASTLRAVPTETGWTLELTVGTSVTQITVQAYSVLDGLSSVRQEEYTDSSGAAIGFDAISAGDVLYMAWDARPAGAQTVPRGVFGVPENGPGSGAPVRIPEHAATYPEYRVYLDKGVSSDWSTCIVERTPPVEGSADYRITAYSTTDNYVELGSDVARTADAPPDVWRFSASSRFALKPSRSLTVGTIADFRDQLVTEGPAYANRGTAPFVTSDDMADWTAIAARCARIPALGRRYYSLAAAVDLGEMLSHEWRLHGVFPITDSSGKIALAQIGVPNASTASLTAIDEEIVSVGWSSMQRGNQTVNRVVLSLGYNVADDSWRTQREVIDHRAYALDHQDRSLTIQPRSNAMDGGPDTSLDPNDLATIALPVLSLFGYPCDFVEVHVSWKLFGLRLGDGVSFSAAHLPDYRTGLRGISAVNGIVTGRKWKIGEAHGTLTVLLSWTNVAGYSPTARVSSQSNVTGNQWDLTVNATKYAPVDPSTGTVVANVDTFFTVGDQVRIVEFDSESATVVAGEVDSINTSTHVIRVTFDGTWTPGSSTWELIFDAYNATGVTTGQKNYCGIAASTGLLGTSDGARTYAS